MVMHDNGFKQKKKETKYKNGPQRIQIVWSKAGKVTLGSLLAVYLTQYVQSILAITETLSLKDKRTLALEG